MDGTAGGILFSVYIPYGYVATGRVCMPGSMDLDRQDKFTEYMGCQKECLRFSLRLLNTGSPFSNRDLELIQRGNTIFYPNSWSTLESILNGDRAGMVDRIIYQPELPL